MKKQETFGLGEPDYSDSIFDQQQCHAKPIPAALKHKFKHMLGGR